MFQNNVPRLRRRIALEPVGGGGACQDEHRRRRHGVGLHFSASFLEEMFACWGLQSRDEGRAGRRQSYYGESKLCFMSADGKTEGNVTLGKDGPIHDVAWSPAGREFVAIYGFMPAKATLFDVKVLPPLLPRPAQPPSPFLGRPAIVEAPCEGRGGGAAVQGGVRLWDGVAQHGGVGAARPLPGAGGLRQHRGAHRVLGQQPQEAARRR